MSPAVVQEIAVAKVKLIGCLILAVVDLVALAVAGMPL